MFYLKQYLIISFASMLGFIAHGAIDIVFDYQHDSTSFFTDEKKYIMEQAAYAFESRLVNENFPSFIPSDYGLPNTVTGTLNYPRPDMGYMTRPTIGSLTNEGNLIGKENQIIIFLGARNNSGSAADAGYGNDSGYIDNSTSDSSDWITILNNRNNSTNYDPLVGTINVNQLWDFYYDTDLTSHSDATTSGGVDFYSAMTREIGNILGFSSQRYINNNALNANISNGQWTGTNGKNAYGGSNIPITTSSSFGTYFDSNINTSQIGCACHPSMLATLNSNTRRPFSELDFAILKDIGYNISNAPVGPNIGGTFTDPTLNGSYFVPVSQSFQDWQNGVPISGSSPAPEPHYIFPILGSLVALGISLKKKLRKVNWTLGKSNEITES